mgnify:CR=1 FL=1|tara:strand:- start:3141 stop:3782 length:642 start_codon:yes stop_codon:yes gene_type:complete
MFYLIKRRFNFLVCSSIFVLVFFANSSFSATRDAVTTNANQALFQRMLQQTTEERDQLSVQVKGLEDKLEQSEKEKQKIEKRLNAKESSLDNFKNSNQEMSDLLQTMKTRMEELIGKFRETAQTLTAAEDENASLLQMLEIKQADIERHVQNNVRLYQINLEILEKYESKGVWDAFVQQEPMTQIKKVEIENIKEEYRTEIEALKSDSNLAKR